MIDLLDRYGGEIEADLADRGHDLLDWFRGSRPWPQLARFIDRLPAHSRYGAALLEDPDVVDRMAEMDAGDNDMTMDGFDPVRALLSALLDAVNQNTAAVIAAAGVDPPDFPPAPRPLTGLEKAKQRLRAQTREAFASLLLGNPDSNH